MVEKDKIIEAVKLIISAIGENPHREGLIDTPIRVAEAYEELFSGMKLDPSDVLSVGFEEVYQEIVVIKDISFVSICEHHLLPFVGYANIGYVPGNRIAGASKLAHALDILSRRPQIQERLTHQLVDSIYNTIKPDGVVAVLSAEHMCMSLRGVKKSGSKIVTSYSRGDFRNQVTTKQEMLSLLLES